MNRDRASLSPGQDTGILLDRGAGIFYGKENKQNEINVFMT